ncbi:hypothetical protein BG011_004906 [Mortierella polycephala]|uniref:Uncharacterized protein n=1 Tax=Mortierella polycephala TaxID=41804 RepID=A0A9P6QH19_9FUNG|nr:hypothetical protein BG011_004906 [Mortierella polycephala]
MSSTPACCNKNHEWDLHPQANRAFENNGTTKHANTQSTASSENSESQHQSKQPCKCGKDEWDLHPAMIRKIENEGSDADVKQLHKIENRQKA